MKNLTEKQKQVWMKRLAIAYRCGYINGIHAAAEFAGTWDKSIQNTPFKFEDLILLKFNLLGTRKPRRKVMPLLTVKQVKEQSR